MKTWVKCVISGAAGTILGGAIGYFIGTKGLKNEYYEDLENEFKEKLENEIEKAKEFYDEKLKGTLEKVKKDSEEQTKNDILNIIKTNYNVEAAADAEEKELEEKIFPHTKPKKELTNYTKYGNKKNYMDQYEEEMDDEEEDDDEYDQLPVHPKEGLIEEPYKISLEDYSNTCLEYDKQVLLYFDLDGILSTEDGENVSEEIKYTVGPDFLKMIDPTDEEGYIRNEKMGSDYDVVIEHASFYDTFVKE